jgi:hypothetical protein
MKLSENTLSHKTLQDKFFEFCETNLGKVLLIIASFGGATAFFMAASSDTPLNSIQLYALGAVVLFGVVCFCILVAVCSDNHRKTDVSGEPIPATRK